MIGAIAAAQSIISELTSLAAAATGAASADASGAAAPTAGASFSDLFNAAVNRLDGEVAGATGQAKSFASGNDDVPLSDVMVSMEQASLSLQLASNIRDKVTSAYSNVMNMSV